MILIKAVKPTYVSEDLYKTLLVIKTSIVDKIKIINVEMYWLKNQAREILKKKDFTNLYLEKIR